MASASNRISTSRPVSEAFSDVQKLDAILATLTFDDEPIVATAGPAPPPPPPPPVAAPAAPAPPPAAAAAPGKLPHLNGDDKKDSKAPAKPIKETPAPAAAPAAPPAAPAAPAATANPASAGEVHTQELNGVFFKRVPLTLPTADGRGTIPSYDYHLENKRDYRVRVSMEFKGTNVKATPGHSAFSPRPLLIEAVLDRGKSTHAAVVTAADGLNDFSFSAEIKVFPDQDDIRTADLEGVKLYTTVTYQDLLTVMVFEAHNTRDFDVEVELDLKGHLVEQSGPMPFHKIIPAGKRATLGSAKSDSEIESAWKWQQVMDNNAVAPPGATVSGNKITQTSELKGVTLKQIMTPGDPTLIEFEIVNNRSKKVSVSIDLDGEGYINFRNQPRPLTGDVFANSTAFIGAVEIRGDATVNWKYKEEL